MNCHADLVVRAMAQSPTEKSRVSPDVTIRTLKRLFAASSASTQAYRRAAGSMMSPSLTTLFAEHSKDHARIASWLSRQIARVCREQHLENPPFLPEMHESHDLQSFLTRDPEELLRLCAQLHDAVIEAFEEANATALAAPLHRFIAREYDQLRWARQGLDRVRRERPTQQPQTSANVMEQLKLLCAPSFEAERFAGSELVR